MNTNLKLTSIVLVALAVAGCRAEAPAPAAAPLVSHEAMVSSLNGMYRWNCTAENEAGTAQRKFVVLERPEGNWSRFYKQEAGQTQLELLEYKKRGAADVYILRDKSEVLIASDGEIVASGRNTSFGDTYPKGRCTRGAT